MITAKFIFLFFVFSFFGFVIVFQLFHDFFFNRKIYETRKSLYKAIKQGEVHFLKSYPTLWGSSEFEWDENIVTFVPEFNMVYIQDSNKKTIMDSFAWGIFDKIKTKKIRNKLRILAEEAEAEIRKNNVVIKKIQIKKINKNLIDNWSKEVCFEDGEVGQTL